MAKISVGPVIGKVDHNSARVLLEVDEDVQVKCLATPLKGRPVQQTKPFHKGRPGTFHLKGLKADMPYELRFEGLTGERPGRFKTFPRRPTRLNVGAVSCNFTIKRADTDLWADLRDRYVRPGDLDLLLHLGDQIYGDSAFYEAQHILNGKAPGNRQQEEQVLNLYRRLYRWAWNDPATQEVLSQVPNLMIWDDHEIRDDWGSLQSDKNPTTVEHYIGGLARRVFREYQRQLWDDDVSSASGLEHHGHVWGPIGVLFLDVRGGRSFHADALRPYLGTPQWSDISEALRGSKGMFSSARALLVVSPVPLAFLSSEISGVGSHVMDDLMDHWSYGAHRKEQLEMIRLLRYWKQAGEGKRELLVLGGDVHIGGHTEIKHQGKTIFRQLIASPITNRPPSWYQFAGVRTLMETHQQLGERYSFEHSNFTNRRNYGVIVARIPDKGTPTLTGSLDEAVSPSRSAPN